MTMFQSTLSRVLLKSARALMMPIAVGLWTLPVHAQTDAQISTLVEALRLAAPEPIGTERLYSDWQIKGENVQGWARFCKQPTTLIEFETNPDLARSIVTCIVADLLQEEYEASGNRLETAVKRSASWWMTGDSTQYLNDSTIAEYVEAVWSFYLGQLQPKG
ncbi:MAG: hypothetical protein ACO31I_12490 [Prochlorotrichaceae cyanobacterium]